MTSYTPEVAERLKAASVVRAAADDELTALGDDATFGDLRSALAELDSLTAERDSLKARVERLEAALRPFALIGQLWLGSPIGDFHTIGIRASPDGEHTLTIGDFRAAAEALESPK